MADIFNREQKVGGTFDPLTSDGLALTFGSIQGQGLLVENLGLNYNQDLQRLYELGSSAVYFIAGRPAGDFTIGKLAAPKDIESGFMKTYGDPCATGTSDIKLTASNKWCTFGGGGPTTTSKVEYTLKRALITSIGMTVAAKDMLIGQNIRGMFVSLEQ